MPAIKIALFFMTILAVVACEPPPEQKPSFAADVTGGAGAGETVPFRARVLLDVEEGLPADARLIVYVLEGNFLDGERRLVAQEVQPVGEASSTVIQIDVPRTELDPDLGYEMYAAMMDGQGRVLMSTAPNRAPVPATGLYFENTFNLRLLPVTTAAQPDGVFRLPGELALSCGDLDIFVRQQESGGLLVTLPDGELSLAPAVATAGGRFSDGRHEFWSTGEPEGFLIMPGEPPRGCSPR
jgi:membrane-bound inhibitor of C-type lysozyme